MHRKTKTSAVVKVRAALAQLVLRALCKGQHSDFVRSLDNPEESQNRIFKRMLENLAKTDFGKEHRITGKESYLEFATKVPVRSYDELEPWLSRQIAHKQKRIITANPVVHVEPTSGSTSTSKQIPYTRDLVASFSDMFAIWVYDLLSSGLCLETGRVFISVSPKIPESTSPAKSTNPAHSTKSEKTTASSQPTNPAHPTKSEKTTTSSQPTNPARPTNSSSSNGFTNDREYLKEPLKSLVSQFLVSPPQTTNIDSFQRELAVTLLCEPDLEIISIWSPTYLLSLLRFIETHRRELEALLNINFPVQSNSRDIDWSRVWPKLKLISCWDSASAQTPATQLKSLFPNIQFQGKGLLLTEAPVTVPIAEAHGSAPLLTNIFFEFEGGDGRLRRLHQLQVGKTYEVIISQPSGLTRYKTNDFVKVTGRFKQTPMLEFVGRANSVCDLVGEKLHESFVRSALAEALGQTRYILAPRVRSTIGYTLLLDSADKPTTEKIEAIENKLCESHHYRLAQTQKQLAPLQVLLVKNLSDLYQRFQLEEGMKLGDIKDAALITDVNRANRFFQFLNDVTSKNQLLLEGSMEQMHSRAPASRHNLPILVEA